MALKIKSNIQGVYFSKIELRYNIWHSVAFYVIGTYARLAQKPTIFRFCPKRFVYCSQWELASTLFCMTYFIYFLLSKIFLKDHTFGPLPTCLCSYIYHHCGLVRLKDRLSSSSLHPLLLPHHSPVIGRSVCVSKLKVVKTLT